jgi:glycosyltransferase involved in cell wall biosynthesis
MSQGVSIIVCCYNSADRIAPTLEHLFKQKVNPGLNWEIIVVNNNSTDNTTEVVKSLFEKNTNLSPKLILVEEKMPGLSFARNKGVACATYDIILFCDDDNHLADDYLELGYSIMTQNSNIGVLGGIGIPLFESPKPFWFDHFSVNYATGKPYNPLQGIHRKKNPNWAYGAGIFILKELYAKFESLKLTSISIGRTGNNLSSGEDYELFYWTYILGYKITYDERLIFKHYIPNSRATLDYLFRLAYGLGQAAALLEIYQHLLGTSHEIIAVKNNLGARIVRHYFVKLFSIKIDLLFSKNHHSLEYIQLKFNYLNLKGKLKSYLSHNKILNIYIAEKKESLSKYINQLT